MYVVNVARIRLEMLVCDRCIFLCVRIICERDSQNISTKFIDQRILIKSTVTVAFDYLILSFLKSYPCKNLKLYQIRLLFLYILKKKSFLATKGCMQDEYSS